MKAGKEHYVSLDHLARPVAATDDVTNIHDVEYAVLCRVQKQTCKHFSSHYYPHVAMCVGRGLGNPDLPVKGLQMAVDIWLTRTFAASNNGCPAQNCYVQDVPYIPLVVFLRGYVVVQMHYYIRS